jgi:hypothetical protein
MTKLHHSTAAARKRAHARAKMLAEMEREDQISNAKQEGGATIIDFRHSAIGHHNEWLRQNSPMRFFPKERL